MIWDVSMTHDDLEKKSSDWVVEPLALIITNNLQLIEPITSSLSKFSKQLKWQGNIAKTIKIATTHYLRKLKLYKVYSCIIIDTNTDKFQQLLKFVKEIEEALLYVPKTMICAID